MAIYLSRKKGGTVATPITPSNSSPAQMTANTPVNPTGNGYAIESYNTKTPSNSSPAALASGEIDKIGGNGYAIESYSSITPSNSSPATITSGSIYKASANGKAVSSVTDITPSNSSPVSLSSGSIYNPSANGYAINSYTEITPSTNEVRVANGDVIVLKGAGAVMEPPVVIPSNSSPVNVIQNDIVRFKLDGYVISSYSSKTPSDSSPASVSSGAIIKASSAGYLVSTSPVNIANTASKDTNFTLSSGSTNSVYVASKPKLILWFQGNYGSGVAAGYGEMGMYDGINNRYRRVTYYSSGANTATDGGDITSISSDTISFKNNGSTSRRYHVMIWY